MSNVELVDSRQLAFTFDMDNPTFISFTEIITLKRPIQNTTFVQTPLIADPKVKRIYIGDIGVLNQDGTIKQLYKATYEEAAAI